MAFSKFLDPKNDFCFKRIFGSERNKDILIHFLNDMLDFDSNAKILDLTFLKTVQDPKIASKKQSIVDVLCHDEQGRSVIVEMQVAKTKGFEKRAQYYAAKAYVSQINQGEQYLNLKEIIFLAITDYVMFADKASYKSDHIILDKSTYDHDLKDFSFTFLELPKFTKSIDELSNDMERWSYFFKHAHETAEKDLERIISNNSIIGRAYEELNQFSWSEQERFTYDQIQKHDRDAKAIEEYKLETVENRGIQKGRIEGEHSTLIKIACRMRDQGMTPHQIANILNVGTDVVNNLLSDLSK